MQQQRYQQGQTAWNLAERVCSYLVATHIYTHTYMHTCTHAHTLTHTHKYMYIHICTCLNVHTCISGDASRYERRGR